MSYGKLMLYIFTILPSVICIHVNLPLSMGTWPVTLFSYSTTDSSKSAQVGWGILSVTVYLVWILFLLLMFLFLFVVAPDTINNHVKTCREEQKSLHFFAPEYGGKSWF